MDEEEFETEEQYAEALPLAWPDFFVPAIRLMKHLGAGVEAGMKYLEASMVQHSMIVAERKLDREAERREREAMHRTGADIARLTVADVERER